jgi:large subunit ribosomal protein L9
MELILLENIKKLGEIGEVVKVQDGYARNYLLPQQKAIRATSHNREAFEKIKSEITKQSDLKVKDSQVIAEKVQGKSLNIVRQASEDGKLYGSVSARDIAISLGEIGLLVKRENIVLDEPLKYLGEYKVKVSLYLQEDVEITVHIVRNEKAE